MFPYSETVLPYMLEITSNTMLRQERGMHGQINQRKNQKYLWENSSPKKAEDNGFTLEFLWRQLLWTVSALFLPQTFRERDSEITEGRDCEAERNPQWLYKAERKSGIKNCPSCGASYYCSRVITVRCYHALFACQTRDSCADNAMR